MVMVTLPLLTLRAATTYSGPTGAPAWPQAADHMVIVTLSYTPPVLPPSVAMASAYLHAVPLRIVLVVALQRLHFAVLVKAVVNVAAALDVQLHAAQHSTAQHSVTPQAQQVASGEHLRAPLLPGMRLPKGHGLPPCLACMTYYTTSTITVTPYC